MLEITLQAAQNEVRVLRGLINASEEFHNPTQAAIGGLCGLIKEACGWTKDIRHARMTYLRMITGTPQLDSTKKLTAGTVSVLLDAWLIDNHEEKGWHPNDRCRQLFVHLQVSPEAFVVL